MGASEPAVFSPFPAGRDGHPSWMVGRLVAGLGLLGVQGSAVGMRPLKKSWHYSRLDQRSVY